MTRSWWIRGALYGLLVAGAVLVLIPSFCHQEQTPRFLLDHARRMRRTVDDVGGLRFGFQVNVEAVAANRLETLSLELQRRLREGPHPADARVLAGEHETLEVVFARPSEHGRLSTKLVDDLGLAEVSRSPSEGRVIVRLSDASMRDQVERRTRAAIDEIAGRLGDPGFGGSVSRDGDTIVVELPGIKTTEADRIRSLLERL